MSISATYHHLYTTPLYPIFPLPSRPFLHLYTIHPLLRHLQVQQLVESGDESSLGDVQEAYDIPQEKAELIVEVSIGRKRERDWEVF